MIWRTFSLATLLGVSSLVGLPPGCEKEELFLEQVRYITEREDYRPPAEGEVTLYRTNGPVSGGSVQALASAPDGTLYAGFFGDGIYRSTDGGDHWIPAKAGLGDPFILSLLAHPNGTVYAGTVRGGIFRSEDGGKTWEISNEGLENHQVASLAVGGRQILYAGTGAGVFVSRDGGRRWEAHNEGLEMVLVRSVTVNPSGTVFIGTAGGGIFKSQSKGKTWQPVNQGLLDDFGMRENFIRSLMFTKDGALYAGSFGGGVFKSTDQGITWNAVNTGLPNLSIRGLILAQNGDLFVGTGQGVFTSSDGGANWTSVSEALPDSNVQSLTLDPAGDLYVGTGTGIFKKSSKSTAWQVLDRGLAFPIVRALSFDPERGIFAGTFGSGVFRSRDAGNLWEPMSQGIGSADVRILVQDRERTMYAGTEKGVYRGDRKARQWVDISEGLENGEITALVMTQEDTLYAGTPQGLYTRSVRDFQGNGSAAPSAWIKADLPEEETGPGKKPGTRTGLGAPIRSVALGPNSEVWAATEDRLFKQTGKDKPWQVIAIEPVSGKVRGLRAADTVYLWTEDDILRGNELSGRPIRWGSIRKGIPSDHKIQTLLIEQGKRGTVIYAGTNRGLFWSQDYGKNWRRAEGSKVDFPVEVILVSSEGFLFLGSLEQGVFLAVRHVPRSGIFGLL